MAVHCNLLPGVANDIHILGGLVSNVVALGLFWFVLFCLCFG